MKTKIKYPCIAEVIADYYVSPLNKGARVLILGEISNMPGHIVIAHKTGRISYGYHIEGFRILTQEET
jgi:hypothetical protein